MKADPPEGRRGARGLLALGERLVRKLRAAHDAVGTGLVASLARPGGDLTGTSAAGEEVLAKQLELLSVAVPVYQRSVQHARQTVLKENLLTMLLIPIG